MKNHLLVSIIIPTYNRAHLLGKTLDSVLVQTYQNWECIVVDDGSTDHTDKVMAAYCAKDPRFQYHYRPQDRLSGGNAARNYGFKICKGEYVNWFDSDDIMLREFLSEKIEVFKRKPELDAVCAYGAYFEKDQSVFEIRKPKLDGDYHLLDYISNELYFTTNGPLWKKTFLNSVSLFDEQRLKIQDTEFHFRMLLKSMKFEFVGTSFLFLIRRGDNRVSSFDTLNVKKLEDVLDYHYYTAINYSLVPIQFLDEYKRIATKKTLQAFYGLIVPQKKLNIRINLLKKHREKLVDVLSISNRTKFKRMKLYAVILSIVLVKKGYSFLK